MIKKRFFICQAALFLVLSLLPGGCCLTSPSPFLYTIAPFAGTPLVPDNTTTHSVAVIYPVRLAPFLQQTGLVTMTTPEQLLPSSNQLWSGALDNLCTTTLAQNMMTLVPNVHVVPYPGPRYATPSFSIETELFNFSPLGKTFSIDAIWTINDLQTKTIARQGRFKKRYPMADTSYLEYTKTASLALGELSTQLAKVLVNQQSNSQ